MWGKSLHVDCYGCHPRTIINRTHIERFLKELVPAIDMVAYKEPRFDHFGTDEKKGYTVVQLIETSNITIHFSEDTNSLYFDLFSCKDFDPVIALNLLEQYFAGKGFRYSWNILNRGELLEVDTSEETVSPLL